MGISAIQVSCDPEQATQFSTSSKGRVGYITDLKIGGAAFTDTKKYKGPLGEDVSAVGIITGADWRGGELDPVGFEMLVGSDVRKAALTYMDKPSADGGVEIAFEIYDHFVDTTNKKTIYFKAFFTDGNVNGIITPDGGKKLRFVADHDAENCYKDSLYPVSLVISPATGVQALHFARVSGAPAAAAWGH